MTMLAAVLKRLVDPAFADAIVGDLEEERRRRALRSGVLAAFWLRRSSIAIILYALWQRGSAAMSSLGRGSSPFRGHVWRQAIRGLRRSPAHTVGAIGVLTLGFTLAVTVFAVVDGVLFKPLPYRAPSELFGVEGRDSKSNAFMMSVAARSFGEWSAALPEANLVAFEQTEGSGVAATPGFLDVLGLPPVFGALPPAGTDASGVTPVLIRYGTWLSAFGGDPNVVGRRLPPEVTGRLQNPRTFIVAGVLQRDFVFPMFNDREMSFIETLDLRERIASGDTSRSLTIIGRLPAGLSMALVQTRLSATAAARVSSYPPTKAQPGPPDHVVVTPVAAVPGAGARPTFAIVASVAVVLALLACVHVTGLLVSRNLDRRRELAMRLAIGASRRHLWGLILIESAVIVGLATVASVLLTQPLLGVVRAMLPVNTEYVKDPIVDIRVITFAALACAFVIAIVPPIVLRLIGRSIASVIAGATMSTAPRRMSGRFALVAMQVSLAMVLSVSATIVAGSLAVMWWNGPGYPTDHMVYAGLRFDRPVTTAERVNEVMAPLRQLPGVTSVTAFDAPFMQSGYHGAAIKFPPGASVHSMLEEVQVSGTFFDALGLKVLEGHLPEPSRFDHGNDVAVLSATAARGLWPSGSAVGQTLTGHGYNDRPVELRVAAVVSDVRLDGLSMAVASVFVPIGSTPWPATVTVFVRSQAENPALGDLVAQVVKAGAPSFTLRKSGLVTDALLDSVKTLRLQTRIFSVFGTCGLVLVGAGVFGLVAASTRRRTREIAVRMTLGGTLSSIVRLVLFEEAKPVAVGIVVGSVLSLMTVMGLPSIQGGVVTPVDPRIWLTAIAFVITATAIGVIVPTLRLGNVDPAVALRQD